MLSLRRFPRNRGDPIGGAAFFGNSHDNARPSCRGERSRSRPAFRRTQRTRRARSHGERDSCAGDGRSRKGEFRSPGTADGRSRHRDRPVHPLSEIRSSGSGLARPRPLRAFGRPRFDAALCAALSRRLREDDDRSDQALPPARLAHAGASGIRPYARRRDHHRSARAGPRQCGWDGDCGTAPRGRIRRRHRRSLHLCARIRRRPDGRHQPGGDCARRPPQAEKADRSL